MFADVARWNVGIDRDLSAPLRRFKKARSWEDLKAIASAIVELRAERYVILNLVGTQIAPVPHVGAGYVRVFSLSTSIGVTCCIALIMFLLEAAGVSSGWFWGCLVVFVLTFPLQIGGSILRCRLLEDGFYRQLRRSAARA